MLAAGMALPVLSPAAHAQDSWWESLGLGPQTQAPRQRTSSQDESRPREALNDLRPDATPFRSDAMVEAYDAAIQRYQEIVARGGWQPINGGRSVRAEDTDQVARLRRRLAMSGELRGARQSYSSWGGGFDDDLEPAVRRYQQSNGLRVTGRVDKATLDALNVPAAARLAQLRLNQQRLRELLSQRIEDRYVLVNAASFELEAVDRHQVELRHRVIVGKPERQTPSVRATIKALNFFPYWRVPDSVASLDLIPKLVKEPEYLQQEQIRVLAGSYSGPEINAAAIEWRTADAAKIKFRQDPGPQNALGLVRLDMPNEHGVYMHDTPMKPLFHQRGRAFSAGCVRVQDVFTLAEWVAKNEAGWEQPGRAREVVAAGQPLDLTLTRPLPVYFSYITAWVEPSGSIQFRADIYNRDGARELVAAYDREPGDEPPPRWSLAP